MNKINHKQILCQEPNCYREGSVHCTLIDPENDEDVHLNYCPDHAYDNGFCMGCGEFWGGIESFDFSPIKGFCENCVEDIMASVDNNGHDQPFEQEFEYYDDESNNAN